MHSLLYDPAPSVAATVSFTALVAVVVAMISTAVGSVAEEGRAARRRKTAAVLLAWLAITGALASSGVLGHFDQMPPPIMVLVAITVTLTTTFALSKLGGRVATGLPLAALIGFQAFRLPLEMILHQLSVDRVLPVQMTYYGMNYDILTGITAIPMAMWAAYGRVPRIIVRLWNIFGLTLLLVIVAIAIASAPLPFRVFMNDPANTIIATLPFVWLPTVLVQAAWVGHLLVFRRLRAEKRQATLD